MPAREGKSAEINKADVKTDDLYKYYRKIYLPNLIRKNKPKAVTRKQYSEILYYYYNKCIEQVVLKNKTLKFTARLGSIKIFKREPNVFQTGDLSKIDLPIDYDATLKLWNSDKEAAANRQFVRHLNEHSDGYIYFYKWVKQNANLKNKNWYKFRATRTHKELLSSEVKKGNVECFKMHTNYKNYKND
jgi:hypothetical protein